MPLERSAAHRTESCKLSLGSQQLLVELMHEPICWNLKVRARTLQHKEDDEWPLRVLAKASGCSHHAPTNLFTRKLDMGGLQRLLRRKHSRKHGGVALSLHFCVVVR